MVFILVTFKMLYIREVFWYLLHSLVLSESRQNISTDTMRLIHSLNQRHFPNTWIFPRRKLVLHPLNCSLLKRKVFVQFYSSGRWMMIWLWMMYNQFLWVIFPQKEWLRSERVIQWYSKFSLCHIRYSSDSVSVCGSES